MLCEKGGFDAFTKSIDPYQPVPKLFAVLILGVCQMTILNHDLVGYKTNWILQIHHWVMDFFLSWIPEMY